MNQKVKSVAIVQRVITHYRCSFYKRLFNLLAEDSIKLTVFAGHAHPKEGFKDGLDEIACGIRVRNRYLYGDVYWQSLSATLKGFDLVIVEQANSALLNYVLLLRRKIFGKPPLIAYWGHGVTLSRVKKKSIQESLKRLMTSQVDFWFGYTDLSRSLVLKTGFPEDKLCVVNNSSDTDEIETVYKLRAKIGRASTRKELGLNENDPTLVYCGRLYRNKELPFLIESCRIARLHLPNLSLVVIGDGPVGSWLRDIAGRDIWIKPVGALYGREKARHLMAADLFVLPSHVGLSILDGFTAGLPVVVARFENDGPEITYLLDGINGVLTAATQDAYAEALVRLLTDDVLRKKMGEAARSTAGKYTVAGMADNFAKGVVRAVR